MTTKLYPPYIEGSLPAFCLRRNSNGQAISTQIKIPFSMNTTVSESQVSSMSLRLRTTSTGSYLFESIFSTAYDFTNNYVVFNLTADQASLLNEGST